MKSMGQQEVYEFLQEHSEKWITSKEISLNLNISAPLVTTSLKRLMNHGEIERRRDPHVKYGFLYRLKE